MAIANCIPCKVKCPFYIRDDGEYKLSCMGISGTKSNFIWDFQEKGSMEQQMDIFCCDYYKNCEVYRMLMDANY